MVKSIAWALTSFCPNKCSHCGSGKESTEITSILPVEKIKKITSANGEPFLRKNILEIIKYGNKKNISFSIVTSGNGLKKEWLDYLLKSKLKNGLIFSLDGDTEEINDKIRFNGSFKLVTKHLKQIKEYKKKEHTNFKVSISHTLTVLTYKRINKFLNLMKTYDIDELNFNYLLGIGECRNKHNLIIPKENLSGIDKIIDKERDNYDFDITYSIMKEQVKTKVKCYSRNEPSINIDNLGTVFPCDQMLPGDMPINIVKSLFKKYKALNINHYELDEIKKKELFIEFRKFAINQSKRLSEFPRCKKCKMQKDCKPCPLIIYNNLINNVKTSPCLTNLE